MSFALGSNILRYHAGMLGDRARVEAYRDAIRATVEPGQVVADLGTGTGLLAFFACQAGAERVYALDDGPVLDLATELCRRNGFADRVTFLDRHSTEAELPEPVDVLVTETLWNWGLGEGLLGSVIDARTRFLRAGGPVVPEVVDVMVALVEDPKAYRWVETWSARPHDLDLTPVREYAVNNLYQVALEPEALVSPAAAVASVDLREVTEPDVGGTVEVEADRQATIHGIGGWFRARLAPGVELSNAPPNATPSWWHAFAPLPEPLPVERGDRLVVEVATGMNGRAWNWSCSPSGDGPGARRQSTMLGMPLRLAPDAA